jgi:hypothetical protein
MAGSFIWEQASPEEVRMDAGTLGALRDGLAERGSRSLLVVRHDHIAYEWYAPGRDATQRHDMASLPGWAGPIARRGALTSSSAGLSLRTPDYAADPGSATLPGWGATFGGSSGRKRT